MKQRDFGKRVYLRCPTTAFKDMFALVFGLEKDGEQLSSLANWAVYTYSARGVGGGGEISQLVLA